MQTIYSIKIKFSTVPPFYAVRTMYVERFSDVAAVKANAKRGGHIMSPQEIINDMARERGECLRAVGL